MSQRFSVCCTLRSSRYSICFWLQNMLFGRSGRFVRNKGLKEIYSSISVRLLEINLLLKQRIAQNKIQNTFTFMPRILHCPYLENSKCWYSYIQTLYISSIRHGTSCVFHYLVLGKWSFYLPSNQINPILCHGSFIVLTLNIRNAHILTYKPCTFHQSDTEQAVFSATWFSGNGLSTSLPIRLMQFLCRTYTINHHSTFPFF